MPHILLIEDDVDLREEIREFLMRRNHTVRDVGRLAEARLAIAERAPDVVISDVNLPDGDGAAFWADHAPRYPTTTWVLVTGDPGAAERIRQLRSDDDVPAFFLLAKPVSMRMLEEFVRKRQGATVATS
jgi:DNA-binding NtrC family response regulator